MTQVSISAADHTVTVNHDGGDLTYVIEKTQRLWDETRAAIRPGPATGFTSQIQYPSEPHRDKRIGGEIHPVRAGDE